MSLTYNLWTIGCQMNEADSRHLGAQLEALGYQATEKAEDADLVVLNTCVVRQSAEDRAISRLSWVKGQKKKNPNLTVGLMGCMVGMREQNRLAKQFPFIDVFMPPSDTEPLMNYLQEHELYDEGHVIDTHEKALHSMMQDEAHRLTSLERGRRVTAHVPVVLGCSHACTFCIIPYRRGAERSRPREEILREIQNLVRQGIREIMLLGQIVDRYGTDFDHDYDLADLLRDVAQIEGLLRIRFLTSHPNWFSDRLIDVVAEHPKLMPHFEIPIQAGNDKVLEDMKRGHKVDAYRALIERVRTRIPDACINTDIIVGFPGETHEEFMDTYRLLDELRLDKIHLAKYSERPKTIAARKMTDDVTAEEKEERRKLIHGLNETILNEINARWQDEEVDVLVESQHKGHWRGRTPHNRLVFFADERDLLGALVRVRIIETGAWSMKGELVALLIDPLPQELRKPPHRPISADDLLSLPQ